MAPEERENPYEGLGTGGKFRKRPFRRTQTTPYDRPSTSLANPNRNNNNNNNGWFSKVVKPARKLITYSAHSIFSSLFRKRLPQSQSPSGTETEQEVRNNHLEESTFKQVSINSSGKNQVTVGNGESDAQINCPDGGGLTELEKLLRQKTFTRSEIDHLTALMRSRTVDTPIREEEKRTEVVPSEPMLFSERKDEDPKTPIVENRIESRLLLTPYVTSSVPVEDVASPAELAKAYMGSRPSKASSSVFGMRSPAAREDPAFLKSNDNLPLSSPIMSIVPRTVKHAGVRENGYPTARTRGRSAIYSMARTPYARIYPTSKGIGRAVEGEPSSSTHSTMDQDMLYGSKQGSVKRRSSGLDNDVGSVGPIRRIRHKANLYSKGSGLPPSGSSLSIARSGLGVGAAQQPSSSMWKPIMRDEVKHSHIDLPEEIVQDTRPSKSGPLPSKSSEMASKILQQLDKMVSPKEKSSESRLPNVNDKSPTKLSPSMLHGQTLRSMEAVDSSKSLDTVKDNRFNIAPGKLSDSAQKLTSQIDKVENGHLKLLAPSDGLVPAVTNADSRNPRNQINSAAKSVDSFVIKSASYPPQKKRAFHMSAQEDCLDMDDGAYSNGDMSSVLAVDNKMTSPNAMAVKDTFGTESVAQENTRSLSAVMASKSSTISEEAHDRTDDSADGSRVGAKVDVSTSLTSSISDPTFKPAIATTKTSFGSHKSASPNGSSAIPPVFNFEPSKDITNSGTIFGLEKVVSSKGLGADFPLVNFGSIGNAGKVPQMLFTSSPVVGESTLPNSSASSDSKLGSSISSATVSAATDSMPKVCESGNVDAKTNIDSVKPSEIPVSSAVTTSLFTPPTSAFTFGQSNGSLAASSSLSSPFTSQNVFSSSPLAASSSSISANSTSSIISSSSSSFSNPLVASSSSMTSSFKFGSSTVPSTGLPVSSSGSEPVETKNREVVGNGNLSSTVFGSSSSAVGNTGSGLFGFSSSATTNQGSVIGSSSGSMFTAQASPATSGFATSTQTQSVPLGSSSSSSSFGLTGNTSFSSGNSLFPSTPVTNAGFSFGSSSFPSSSSAINIFNSGTTFGFGTPASSSAVNSVSSNNVSSSSLFGSSSWQPSKSSPFGSAFSQTSTASTSSPTMFTSTPQFSFTSAATTTSTQPTFGNPNSPFTFGSAPVNNDQMTTEDSMAEDTVQATPPATPVFGQQATPPATPIFGQQATPPATPVFGQQATPSATPVFGQQATPSATPVFGQQSTPVQSNFVFGASTPSGANPFQFASQQNTTPANPSPFQASGSVEFSAGGGSFSLGTGGGDKSGRRIVKVKGRQRKR